MDGSQRIGTNGPPRKEIEGRLQQGRKAVPEILQRKRVRTRGIFSPKVARLIVW